MKAELGDDLGRRRSHELATMGTLRLGSGAEMDYKP